MTAWFAIKARPGTQRMAKPRFTEDASRKGEFIIERNLRDAGFDVFMPSTVREVRHHRTDEYMVKRFPLMVGYAFVRSPRDFYALSDCDGVSAILGVAGCPMRINADDIEAIRTAELLELDAMERRRAARISREKKESRKLTRREVKEMYPKHRSIVITGDNYLSGMKGYVTDGTGRNTIKAMIETLHGLIPVELGLEHFSEAV